MRMRNLSNSASFNRQFAQFVTFSSAPAEFLPFVYIPVRLTLNRLIRQFAQFVTSITEKRCVRLIRHLQFRV